MRLYKAIDDIMRLDQADREILERAYSTCGRYLTWETSFGCSAVAPFSIMRRFADSTALTNRLESAWWCWAGRD
jgi:hypothetical protein